MEAKAAKKKIKVISKETASVRAQKNEMISRNNNAATKALAAFGMKTAQ